MLRSLGHLLPALWLAGCASITQTIKNQPCELAAQPFDVLAIDGEQHEIRLITTAADGTPLRTLDQARAAVEAQGDSVVAVTNAGIYEPGYLPTGLFVEDGVVRNPLNVEEGRGNFYLKPNGVFLLTDRGDARIVASSEYDALGLPVRYATQSGPLLLDGGAIHPAFTPGSENCRLRSGVGVDADGQVFLAISNGAVNFYDFARFFRDRLGATDALYLDGGISALYAPTIGRFERTAQRYAGFLVVVHRRTS